MLNTRQYEFADLSLTIGGKDITGFRAIKYSEKIEREALHAKGRHAHSIQSGNVSVEGEITLLQSELETLTLAGGGSILNLVLDAVVCYGGNSALPMPLITDRIEGIHFTESTKELKQGDKNMEVTLPFLALRVVAGSGLSVGGVSVSVSL